VAIKIANNPFGQKKELLNDEFRLLSSNRKKEVLDFIKFLRLVEEAEATNEILSDEMLMKSILNADEEIKARRFKNWEEVKKKGVNISLSK
jgi:hypothetical protein